MLGLIRGKKYVTDFTTLADGRIVSLSNAGLLSGQLTVPDLRLFHDANPALVSRADAVLALLQKDRNLKVVNARSKLEPKELVAWAVRAKAQIVTADRSLTTDKIPVLKLDDLFEALKPVYLPGNELMVKIIKKGKESDEGVGYLEGGVKVVVDDAANLVGKEIDVVILGALDTAVGRVVFAKPKYTEVR